MTSWRLESWVYGKRGIISFFVLKMPKFSSVPLSVPFNSPTQLDYHFSLIQLPINFSYVIASSHSLSKYDVNIPPNTCPST